MDNRQQQQQLPASVTGQGEVPNTAESIRNKLRAQMKKLDQMNEEALDRGNNKLGNWIGPSFENMGGESAALDPVFILAVPVEKLEPHTWTIDGVPQNAFKLIRRYVCMTQNGPIAVFFNKYLADDQGNRHPLHVGPGGNHDLDNDQVEGGEKGTFLRKLGDGRRDKAYHYSIGARQLGLGKARSGKYALYLGDAQMEEAVYSESNTDSSFWGIEMSVADDVVQDALKSSIDASSLPAPLNEDALVLQKRKQQADLIDSILN